SPDRPLAGLGDSAGGRTELGGNLFARQDRDGRRSGATRSGVVARNSLSGDSGGGWNGAAPEAAAGPPTSGLLCFVRVARHRDAPDFVLLRGTSSAGGRPRNHRRIGAAADVPRRGDAPPGAGGSEAVCRRHSGNRRGADDGPTGGQPARAWLGGL